MTKEEVMHIAIDAMPVTEPGWVDYLSGPKSGDSILISSDFVEVVGGDG